MTIQKLPFSLFKRKSSPFYYVKFKNEVSGGYLPPVSTKETDKNNALKVAWSWYSQGKIKKDEKELSLDSLSIFNEIKKNDIKENDALKVLELLKEKGIIKSYVKKGSKSDIKFADYLLNFWTFDKSEYLRDKTKSGKAFGQIHVKENFSRIERFWLPYFKDKLLGEITRQDLKDFSYYIQKKEIANSTKNKIWLAGAQAVRYAYNNELIERDITAGIAGFHGKSKEREILTPEMAQALFSVSWDNKKAMLANILAMCTGLRAGEIRALRKCDLGINCIYINHSWSDTEGLKSTKNGESRVVQFPFSQITQRLLELADSNPHDHSMSAFIFYATIPGQPTEAHIFIDGLRNALLKIGLKEDECKKYCFHSWRHFYTSYMAEHVSAKLLQSQTGHKTRIMLEHYSNHKVSGDDEQIQKAQLGVFGDIVNNICFSLD